MSKCKWIYIYLTIGFSETSLSFHRRSISMPYPKTQSQAIPTNLISGYLLPAVAAAQSNEPQTEPELELEPQRDCDPYSGPNFPVHD